MENQENKNKYIEWVENNYLTKEEQIARLEKQVEALEIETKNILKDSKELHEALLILKGDK